MGLTLTEGKLTEAIRDRLERLEHVDGALTGLVAQLVDGKPEARPELLAERTRLKTEQEALGEELALLRARRGAARLQAAETHFEEADAAYQEAHAKVAAARKHINAVLDDRRRAYGGDRLDPATPEARETWAKHEKALVDAKTAGWAAEAALDVAASKRRAALAALDALRDGDA